MPSGIDVIIQDHLRVSDLFDQFGASPHGSVAGQIFGALAVHDEAEHAALYPMSVVLLNKSRVLQRFEKAHSTIKALIEHARGQEGAALVDAMEALRQAVVEHVDEEEKDLLPALGKKATPEQLESLASRINQNKQRVG